MTTQITLHHGDNRDSLRRLIDAGMRVHSVVSDPPYGLVSVTKRFGGEKAAPAKFGSDGAFQRASAGFMGSKWDGTGIERDPEFWRLVYEILLPGGYCVAFSGARTGHWQACAMETAGFIMHPMMGWLFGQGFPKAHNAAKAIDKKLGQQGGVIPSGNAVRRMIPGARQNATGDWAKTDDPEYQPGTYVPATPEAEQWQGWAYGAQSLKPALEPIYLAQKPFSEKDGVLNLLKHGVGALNINGCRVPSAETWGASGSLNGGETVHDYGDALNNSGRSGAHFLGRHPANLLHDGSAEVVALFPQSAGQQAAVRGTEPSHTGDQNTHCYGEFDRVPFAPRKDSGSAARFFNAFPMSEADYAELAEAGIICDLSSGAPVFYHAKATKADRAGSRHPTVKPVALIRWLCRLVTPPGGTVLDPFAGSGTTAQAARDEGFDCVLMEAEDQFADHIRRRFDLPHRKNTTEDGNHFPTSYDSCLTRTDGERLASFDCLLEHDDADDFDALLA